MEKAMATKLVTIVIGERYLQDFNNLGRVRFEQYADRCGYESIVIDKPVRKLPNRKFTWQKLCLQDLPWFGDGSKVICLDSDILIAKDAPPFPDIPDDCVGGVMDKGVQGLNSGVLVYNATQATAEIFEECHQDPDPFWDQRALWRVLQEKNLLYELDSRFHCMFYARSWTVFRSLFKKYWLYHSLGSKKKLRFIEYMLRVQGR